MASTKFFNLTDSSRIQKHDKQNPFPELLKKSQKAQNEYEARLKNDDTKTTSEKSRLAYANAVKIISALLKDLDNQTTPRREKDSSYKARVTKWLGETSTTNTLILSSLYSALKDWPVPKLLQASATDKDVSKMLLTSPQGRYGFELTADQKQRFFNDAEKHTLGSDLADYQSNAKVLEALTIAGESLAQSHNEIYDNLKKIERRVVNE